MTERFPAGSTAYTKDGRTYIVDEAEGGIVYCSLPNGTETDFPESALFNEDEWAAHSGGSDDILYGRIKRAKAFASPAAPLNRIASEKILTRSEKLSPGLLDFAAFTIATRSLTDSGHSDQADGLSIIKCRDVFDDHTPEVCVSALASVLGADAAVLVSVADLGDNLLRAMIDKGMAVHRNAFEDFCDRPRR